MSDCSVAAQVSFAQRCFGNRQKNKQAGFARGF